MAKRYKTKKKKLNTKKIAMSIIFCFIFIGLFVFCSEIIFHNKEIQEETIDLNDYDILQSDLLNIREMKEEIGTILEKQIQGIPLTKVSYQFETIDKGKVVLEYYQEREKDGNILIRVAIDIQSKKLVSIEKQDEKEKKFERRTAEIITNCDENIREDFYLKEREKKEESYINIIVTETEVMINIVEK